MRDSISAFKYIWREPTQSLRYRTSHRGGETRWPLESHIPRVRPSLGGRWLVWGSCRNAVLAPVLARGWAARRFWRGHTGAGSQRGSGKAEGYVMLSSRSGCPRCSPAVPAPHLQALRPRGLHIANSPPKHPAPNQTHRPEKHTVV